MVRSFRCRETERIFHGGVPPSFPPDIQRRARAKLMLLDAAAGLADLQRVPGLRLEALRGGSSGAMEHPRERSVAHLQRKRMENRSTGMSPQELFEHGRLPNIHP